ncbi:hypothetical protein GGH94_005546 [Coemansia aciculifera]|uniref:Uncharacterized protein n=1 Tax=Coemansia aciculifera TaxID=417176 RepID=A0A9W8IDB5_9FUNG|nr:hypothetical protein GGH94_005546 [Coemansia aciculifera]KAJ2870398.1 hypothetical protein GGH93_005599 [Coemansia aciculifera]
MSYSRLGSGDALPLYNRGGSSRSNSSESSRALGTISPVINARDSTDFSYYEFSSKHRKPASTNKWVNLVLHAPKSAFIAGLLTICVTSYLLSLQAGDLVYINEHLGIIGAELVVSIISLTIVTVMLYAGRIRNNTRRGTLLMILCIFAALYCYDHGERFEHHGFYNLLVFLLIFVPVNLAIALFYVLWSKIDNFIVYFFISLAIGGIAASVSLIHYRRVFDQGTLGVFQYTPGECQWTGRNIPFIDLLPAGTQNFWAGSMHCRPESQQIKASVDGDGLLHVACESEDKDVFVDVLPETRQWPLKDKDMWSVFNHLILEQVTRLPYSSSRPFVLNETTQAVVVRCGSSSTIITRVSPPLAKLPVYVPPSDSDTRPSSGSASAPEPARFNVSGAPQMQLGRPNVIYLMLDAVSHRQFYRRLPKSAQVLKTIHRPGNHRLFELYRYHSVGFSTDNNTKAAYTGEIYPSHSNPLPIWAYYRDRGYVTARIEASCDDWTKKYIGSKYESQEYSVGNRSLDYELTSPFCLPEYFPNVGNPYGNFKGPNSITAHCLYGRYVHDWAFDYLYQLRNEFHEHRVKQLAQQKDARPFMITATFIEGHEGTGEVLRTLDDSLAAFLESMRDSGELDDTVLIVGADHGLHMGLNFAFLQNGRIEHKNPFLVMSVPEWLHEFSEKYQTDHGSEEVSPFAANEQRLVTPFETHHTFRVLADWPEFETDSWKHSLFAAQRAGRTCEEAGIGANFCMCKIPATE